MIPDSRHFEAALDVIAKLRAAGHEAYLAGGCVRDLLLGRAPEDFDVATSATPDVVLGLFDRTFAVGAHFGVVLVAHDDGDSYFTTEVATFRSDGAYSDGRHPDAVRYTTSAEEDVRRRDFTINGLLLDPEKLQLGESGTGSLLSQVSESRPFGKLRAGSGAPNGLAEGEQGLKPGPCLASGFGTAEVVPCYETGPVDRSEDSAGVLRAAVIDFVSGLADLDAGVVRAIGRAEERFEEDRLRMLRGVRFAARLGFELEPGTAAAIRSLAPRIATVSRERVRDELTRMLTEGHARRAFELLDETGLLAQVLPEVARMKGVEQPPQYHPEGDVWVHTLGLLAQLEEGCPMTLAWGALLHDVGKPPTFRRAPDRIRFDGHVEVGVAMTAEICKGFRFSNEDTRQILALVGNHMRFADAERMKASTLKRFFRLEGFDEHLALHRMDCLAGSGNLDHWEFVRARRMAMPEEIVRPAPLITGRELIAAGYAPGAAFKQMLRAVEDAQLEGTIATAEEALRLVESQWSDSRGRRPGSR
ncbi:MAG: CCA tRNA nucleotidyltransferase [Terracidiphilus sp.]|nr:CCA tRNA nucleotidyltransferase [Terracidiphilus sp.]